jgi:hypothetical protein
MALLALSTWHRAWRLVFSKTVSKMMRRPGAIQYVISVGRLRPSERLFARLLDLIVPGVTER